MLNTQERFISIAASIYAQVNYDMSFSVDINEFFALNFKSNLEAQAKLNFNLYTNHIHNAPL